MNFLRISKFFLYLAPLSVVIVYLETLFPFIVGKYVFFRIVVGLALIFYLLGWAFQQKSQMPQKFQIPNHNHKFQTNSKSKILNPKFYILNPLIVAVALFVLIYLLAGFFGYNPPASFWSNFERGEGGLQMLYYFVFFILLVLLFKDQESWRKLFIVSLGAAGLVIIYGLLGALGVGGFIGQTLCLRFSGSLGNPAYTGTYLIFALFYAGYLLADNNQSITKSLKKHWLLVFLSIVFIVFIFLTQTRGAFLGLGIAVIAGLIYSFFNLPSGKTRKFVLFLAMFLIVLGLLAVIFRQSFNLMPFCESRSQILDLSVSAESFQTRLILWKQSIEAFKERPLLGWGPENFAPAFEKYFDPRLSGAWYDRAHNIFFDYLVMTGLLGLLSFVSIFVVYYWQFFKASNKTSNQELVTSKQESKKTPLVASCLLLVPRALLFSLPIAYLVQGLVLFDVLPIYVNLFLFLAFANYRFSNQ